MNKNTNHDENKRLRHIVIIAAVYVFLNIPAYLFQLVKFVFEFVKSLITGSAYHAYTNEIIRAFEVSMPPAIRYWLSEWFRYIFLLPALILGGILAYYIIRRLKSGRKFHGLLVLYIIIFVIVTAFCLAAAVFTYNEVKMCSAI